MLPIPGVKHGRRILTSVIEAHAKDKSEPWVSVPVDGQDLSQGYRDISFSGLNNAANHAAHWLRENLPETTEPFQCFAYAGPKDLRYPILAVAAAKLQKVMVLPSPLVTAEAQLQILEKKGCTIYLRPLSMAAPVEAVLQKAPHIQAITVPDTEAFMQEAEAAPINYSKTWDEGRADPWLVFHTSGTTGNPKPVTYTHQMMCAADVVASIPDIGETQIHHYAQQRCYTPLPSLHFIGMTLSLSMTTFVHMTAVLGPPTPPTPDLISSILHHGRVTVAMLPPVLIDALCQSPSGLHSLSALNNLHFAGAPLSQNTASLLLPHVPITPGVGSTEAGGYWTAIHPHRQDAWDHFSFDGKHTGITFEPRANSNLHELVFVKRPSCALQPIFLLYPDLDRFETKDLWEEHPVHKGLWKIIGRTDDYIYLSHGDGLNAALLEPEIVAHPAVKLALIGGHGRPAPVLLIELLPTAEQELRDDHGALVRSLLPYIEKVNTRCHECVRLSPERIILARAEKPFITTLKGSVARPQTLALYEEEIAKLFK
ncbi:AMP-binding enzyme [Aspergillus sclerotiicarbonarius CBS 121057]|uniref:AMP-binding enzyme n=1 Tax=Aspergillus sclerotiicarbonarius (strain CBS 121057 / IBT 28362) TaxID=1448318 RepID=A0A319DX07_ASPSB|nr:AMP-binding enzyme [Aspergillus sclerotiicarbonarius CBS 121057]